MQNIIVDGIVIIKAEEIIEAHNDCFGKQLQDKIKEELDELNINANVKRYLCKISKISIEQTLMFIEFDTKEDMNLYKLIGYWCNEDGIYCRLK